MAKKKLKINQNILYTLAIVLILLVFVLLSLNNATPAHPLYNSLDIRVEELVASTKTSPEAKIYHRIDQLNERTAEISDVGFDSDNLQSAVDEYDRLLDELKNDYSDFVQSENIENSEKTEVLIDLYNTQIEQLERRLIGKYEVISEIDELKDILNPIRFKTLAVKNEIFELSLYNIENDMQFNLFANAWLIEYAQKIGDDIGFAVEDVALAAEGIAQTTQEDIEYMEGLINEARELHTTNRFGSVNAPATEVYENLQIADENVNDKLTDRLIELTNRGIFQDEEVSEEEN